MAKDDTTTKTTGDTSDPHVNPVGELKTTDEKAASDMTLAEAEKINANVNPAPVPEGAQADRVNQMVNNLDKDSENGSGNAHAPHETGLHN